VGQSSVALAASVGPCCPSDLGPFLARRRPGAGRSVPEAPLLSLLPKRPLSPELFLPYPQSWSLPRAPCPSVAPGCRRSERWARSWSFYF